MVIPTHKQLQRLLKWCVNMFYYFHKKVPYHKNNCEKIYCKKYKKKYPSQVKQYRNGWSVGI